MQFPFIRPAGHRRCWNSGQALVEFAFALPIFLLLVLGTFDFGRAAIIVTTIQNSAREGARHAIISPTDISGIQVAARSTAVVADPQALTTTVTYPTGSSSTGSPVKVTVQYQLHFLTSVVTGFLPAGVSVTKSSQMTIE